MAKIIKAYDLNIETVGVTNRSAQGFKPVVAEPGWDFDHARDLVVVSDTGVYLSNNVASYLIDVRCRPYDARIGRKHMYRWTPELANDVLERAAYPNRNANETWVSERNFAIASWIENLIN